jgi:hypothetical protein
MFAPIFDMQNSIARSYVEMSAKTARRFWQLEYGQPVRPYVKAVREVASSGQARCG